MNAALLGQIWSLIVDLKHLNLADRDTQDLVEYLIAELKQREIISEREIPETTVYISSNIPLIHDLLHFSSI